MSLQYNICCAQTSIGLEAGVSSSFLNTNISNRASSVINYNVGYTINIPFQYKIKDWLYIETGAGITQKNYFIDRTDSFAGLYQSFKNTYLQIPLLLKAVYGKRLQVFGDFGVYGGYWLTGRLTGKQANIFSIDGSGRIQEETYNEKYTISAETDNRLEFGWVAGVGAQYHINRNFMLVTSAKYFNALTDQHKAYMINQIPQYNQTFTFSLGGMLSFK